MKNGLTSRWNDDHSRVVEMYKKARPQVVVPDGDDVREEKIQLAIKCIKGCEGELAIALLESVLKELRQ